LYILTFTFFYSRWEDKRFCTAVATITIFISSGYSTIWTSGI
jgi:hypothetical protein